MGAVPPATHTGTTASLLALRGAGLRDAEFFGEQHRLSGMGRSVVDGSGWGLSSGAVLLERRELYPTDGPWIVVGFLPDDAVWAFTTVKNATAHPHAASMGYHYRVRNVEGNGWIDEQPLEPFRLDFDSGSLRIILPARPIDLHAAAIKDGKYLIRWRYDRWGQGADPTGFRVYTGDPVSYAAQVGSDVTFDGRSGLYSLTTGVYADGTSRAWAVRSHNAAGQELNEYETNPLVAHSSGPAQFAEVVAFTERSHDGSVGGGYVDTGEAG